jgi:hypothetical protein
MRLKRFICYNPLILNYFIVNISDLFIHTLLIDHQGVGKRSLHLMDTVNAKKRWRTIYWRVNKFLKQTHKVTRLAKE